MILLPAANQVGVSKTSLFDIPLGRRYHTILIDYLDGNASPVDMLTAIGDIRVKINQRVDRLHSASELNTQINKVNGSQYAYVQQGSGATQRQFLAINFAEPWRKDKQDQQGLAFTADRASGINDFQIEIDVTASASPTCALQIWAVFDAPVVAPQGGALLSKVYRKSYASTSTTLDFTIRGNNDPLQALYFKNPTGTYITKGQLKLGNTPIIDLVTREANAARLLTFDMYPNYSTTAAVAAYEMVLDCDDPVVSALPPNGQDFQVHLEFAATASGSVTVLEQRLGLID